MSDINVLKVVIIFKLNIRKLCIFSELYISKNICENDIMSHPLSFFPGGLKFSFVS